MSTENNAVVLHSSEFHFYENLPFELFSHLYRFFSVEELMKIKNVRRAEYDLAINELFNQYSTSDEIKNLVLGWSIYGEDSYFIPKLKSENIDQRIKWFKRFESCMGSLKYDFDFKFNAMRIVEYLFRDDSNIGEEIAACHKNTREKILKKVKNDSYSFYLFPSFCQSFSKTEFMEFVFQYYKVQSQPVSLALNYISSKFQLDEWRAIINKCLEEIKNQHYREKSWTLTHNFFVAVRNILSDIILNIPDQELLEKLLSSLIDMLNPNEHYFYVDISNILAKVASKLSFNHRRIISEQLMKNMQLNPNADTLKIDSIPVLINILLAFSLPEFEFFINKFGDMKKDYFRMIIEGCFSRLPSLKFDMLFDFLIDQMDIYHHDTYLFGGSNQKLADLVSKLSAEQFNLLFNKLIGKLNDVSLISNFRKKIWRCLKVVVPRLSVEQMSVIWDRFQESSYSENSNEYLLSISVLVSSASKLNPVLFDELYLKTITLLDHLLFLEKSLDFSIFQELLSGLPLSEIEKLKIEDFVNKIKLVVREDKYWLVRFSTLKDFVKLGIKLNTLHNEIDFLFEIFIDILSEGNDKRVQEILVMLSPYLSRNQFEELKPYLESDRFDNNILISLLPRLTELSLNFKFVFKNSGEGMATEYAVSIYQTSKRYGRFYKPASNLSLNQTSRLPVSPSLPANKLGA
jgi:hypothetical protein